MLRFWLEHLGAVMVTGGAWRRRRCETGARREQRQPDEETRMELGDQAQKSVRVHSGTRRRVEETRGMRAGRKRLRRWPARAGGAADQCSRPPAFVAAKLVFARVRDSAELLTPCRGLQLRV